MGAQEMSEATSNSMQRVKVYRLNDDGKWDDQGTGHVSVDHIERPEDLSLFVIDEEDNETLLLHRISSDDIYRKQDDTIISWKDPEYSTELALSFQEITGCSFIWDHISHAQRNLQFNTLSNETFHTANHEFRELPAVEISSLPLILKVVAESGIADQMRLTELILNNPEFFRKLMGLFHICEDQKNIDGLHMIFKIVKGIVMLNSLQIYEKIFGDELMMDVIGSLEYDPEVCRIPHRQILKEHVVFKEAIPIKDPIVLSKIHQTYRVGYLKDAILPRLLDDAIISNLNSIIHSNNAVVISLLKDDSNFIQELFGRLRSPVTSVESRTNLVYFLHEFCCVSKSLQVVQQHRLFRDLVNEGIFDIIADVLRSKEKRLVLTGTDILILFMNQDPNLLRSYIIRQQGIHLLGLLVNGMITDFGEDMNCQFLEILRCLLDSFTLPSGSQRDVIVQTFYEYHFSQLIDVITSSCPLEGVPESVGQSSRSGDARNCNGAKPEILSNICELLCFCVVHYPNTIRSDFLLHNVIGKVLLLTRRRERFLVIAAVRFVRTVLSQNDEHLINHIIKNNLLKPIVDAFVSNGHRYNLLNSAVLELFDHIRKEKVSVLRYLVESFWDRLVDFESLTTINSLRIKYDQSLEIMGSGSTDNAVESRKRFDERAVEKEEEDYFNADSDEDTASAGTSQSKRVAAVPMPNGHATGIPSLSPRRGGLVDYEDDDEDDDNYRPPPRKHPEACDEDGLVGLKKRKVGSREESEAPVKKVRVGRNAKSRDGVFAALCSTLSHAVLPGKKSEASTDDKRGKEVGLSRSCSDCAQNASEIRQMGGEECALIPPSSSPEMTVNGS